MLPVFVSLSSAIVSPSVDESEAQCVLVLSQHANELSCAQKRSYAGEYDVIYSCMHNVMT
jgi:hypothetical protein